MGFCLLFDDVGNRFILAGDDEYNYCRKEPVGVGHYPRDGKRLAALRSWLNGFFAGLLSTDALPRAGAMRAEELR